MSIAAAEAYGMMQDLKEKFPKEFKEAKEEFEDVYGAVGGNKISYNE